MLAFGIYITHGVACYVAIDLTWNKYIVKKITNDRHKLFWEYVVRTVICLITCKPSKMNDLTFISNHKNRVCNFFFFQNNHFYGIPPIFFFFCQTVLLAVAIPKLDLFISLVGALCLSTLGLIFPALIETCVFWRDTCGVSRSLMVIKNIFIACFGFFAVFVGTSTSILAIYQSFTQ